MSIYLSISRTGVLSHIGNFLQYDEPLSHNINNFLPSIIPTPSSEDENYSSDDNNSSENVFNRTPVTRNTAFDTLNNEEGLASLHIHHPPEHFTTLTRSPGISNLHSLTCMIELPLLSIKKIIVKRIIQIMNQTPA